ncbi:YbhB/YbcL family Raf kinase inhibitor-like protein [Legionella waltersii]|uniref:Phosphatidylethanolamine-binding protein n=1 Tax=Legionella waltersii TaxID=66969 RepID=A0A0W1ABR5_9GAMM|nr:YbhB/YbcL family Raf kinase inhibitor-like protein [Legionella waltersii]KTD78789.1 phosphatidylethanolamine-binding protein [Legionella waltersii]SNV11134.1 phosphatidylethanolamine-binding protein [Legionella waltersii]
MRRNSLLVIILGMIQFNALAGNFTLESPSFQSNSMIPAQFTCAGTNVSPPLNWQGVPPNTKSLALVVNDPDAPNGLWTHWILFNIPPSVNKLEEGTAIPQGAATALNSWNNAIYQGPCPNLGAHRYVFTLYALDTVLDQQNGTATNDVLDAITGHVIENAVLVGLYQK